MLAYIMRRLLMMVGILIGVVAVTFVLSRILPGSPIELMLGHRPTPEQIEAARSSLGLDLPMYQQFYNYLVAALHGDFGTRLRTGQPVLMEIGERMAATFELTTLAVIIVIIVGIPLGVLSAVKQNSMIDHAGRSISIAGVALPVFLIGMMLQMLFYGQFGWFPLEGRINSEVMLDYPFQNTTGLYLLDSFLSGQWIALFSSLQHLVLPVLTLAIASLAVVTRITRNTMIEVLGEDYIKTALAYGIPLRKIHYRFALKATMIPMLTVIGLTYGFMLGGSVVVEYVFDWPGLGSYVVGAITRNDFPAVMGVTMFLATLYLSINLIVDLLYYVVDPRLRVS